MTDLLAAAVGELPYPEDHPLLRPVCPRGPVGLHLLHTATGGQRCPCRHPLPGLSPAASDVAHTLAATTPDWLTVLDIAPACVQPPAFERQVGTQRSAGGSRRDRCGRR